MSRNPPCVPSKNILPEEAPLSVEKETNIKLKKKKKKKRQESNIFKNIFKKRQASNSFQHNEN